MQVVDLLEYGKKSCQENHLRLLLSDLLKFNHLELQEHLKDPVSNEVEELFKEKIKLLESGKPLQYIIGNVNFYGLEFEVNENVLIPRFETEELVENAIKYIKKFFTEPVDILDLGCGSGVIGLTLEKKVSTNSVDLVDISPAALEVSTKNCVKHNSKANTIQSDMFENVPKKYDVIISNPPYIKTTEEIEEIVKNNEPHLALYAGPDGLDCYKKILKGVENHLKDKALIAFEIGYTQAADLEKLIKEYLPTAKYEVKQDLSGKDRMLFIFKNIE